MTNKEFEVLHVQRRRQFIDWLFSTVENELHLPLSTLSKKMGIDYRTLVNLKKGVAVKNL